jgi:hypothetical protein
MLRLLVTGWLTTLCFGAFVSGCGGGGSSSPSTEANEFTGNYQGVYYVTAGKDVGDARFFSLNILANGSISSPSSSLNAGSGTVQSNGKISFTRREDDGTTSQASGKVLSAGTATLVATNSSGSAFLAAFSRVTNRTKTFDGNYYGTTRVRTGTGIGTVEAITISVVTSGASIVTLTDANGASQQVTGTADLKTGTLTATGPAGADTITITVQLAKTGQAGGTFDTATSHGTVALNKSTG